MRFSSIELALKAFANLCIFTIWLSSHSNGLRGLNNNNNNSSSIIYTNHWTVKKNIIDESKECRKLCCITQSKSFRFMHLFVCRFNCTNSDITGGLFSNQRSISSIFLNGNFNQTQNAMECSCIHKLLYASMNVCTRFARHSLQALL